MRWMNDWLPVSDCRQMTLTSGGCRTTCCCNTSCITRTARCIGLVTRRTIYYRLQWEGLNDLLESWKFMVRRNLTASKLHVSQYSFMLLGARRRLRLSTTSALVAPCTERPSLPGGCCICLEQSAGDSTFIAVTNGRHCQFSAVDWSEDWTFCPVVQLLWLIIVSLHWLLYVTPLLLLRVFAVLGLTSL